MCSSDLRPEEARGLLEGTLAELSPEDELHAKALARYLRYLARFGSEQELSRAFAASFAQGGSDPEGILLAEARLRGFASAWQRFLFFARQEDISLGQLQSCALSLLEHALETDQEQSVSRALAFLPALSPAPRSGFEDRKSTRLNSSHT